MNVKTALLAIGLYLLVSKGLSQASNVVLNNLRVDFNNVRMQWGGWSDPGAFFASIQITVDNGNPAGVTVNGFQGGLYYGIYHLGNVSLPQIVTISPNNISSFEVVARVTLDRLPLEIAQLIQNQDYLEALRLKGTLFTSLVNVPIDQNIPVLV